MLIVLLREVLLVAIVRFILLSNYSSDGGTGCWSCGDNDGFYDCHICGNNYSHDNEHFSKGSHN